MALPSGETASLGSCEVLPSVKRSLIQILKWKSYREIYNKLNMKSIKKLIIIKCKEALVNRPVGKFIGWPRPEEAEEEEING